MDESIMDRLITVKGYLGGGISSHTGDCVACHSISSSNNFENMLDSFADIFADVFLNTLVNTLVNTLMNTLMNTLVKRYFVFL